MTKNMHKCSQNISQTHAIGRVKHLCTCIRNKNVCIHGLVCVCVCMWGKKGGGLYFHLHWIHCYNIYFRFLLLYFPLCILKSVLSFWPVFLNKHDIFLSSFYHWRTFSCLILHSVIINNRHGILILDKVNYLPHLTRGK